MNELLYDLSTFRQMDSEDPGALKQIVSVFTTTTPAVLKDLNNAYEANDLNALAHMAHKLKATIDILSIHRLIGVIRQIEQIAITYRNKNELAELMNTLNSTLETVFIEIEKEIS